jgi:hypothetical protein
MPWRPQGLPWLTDAQVRRITPCRFRKGRRADMRCDRRGHTSMSGVCRAATILFRIN